MLEFRKGFLELVREDGRTAWIRVDEIGAFWQNEVKRDGKLVSSISIQTRNPTITFNTPMTAPELIYRMEAAAGVKMHVIGPEYVYKAPAE